MTRSSLILLCISLLGLSCTSPNDADLPLVAPGLSTPIATGINITSSEGPQILATWGRPGDGPASASGSELSTPQGFSYECLYPNPSPLSCVAVFAIPDSSVVSIWVVRERWVNDPDADINSAIGATVNTPQIAAVKELLRDKMLVRGRHAVLWDGKDQSGADVRSGFYRIYLRFAGRVFWRDEYISRPGEAAPAGLERYCRF